MTPGQPDPRVVKEILVQQDQRGQKVVRVQPVPLEVMAQTVVLVLKVVQVQQDQQGQLAQRVTLVTLEVTDQMDQLELKVPLGQRVHKEAQEQQDRKDLLEPLVLLELQERKEILDHKDQLDHKEQPVQRVVMPQ